MTDQQLGSAQTVSADNDDIFLLYDDSASMRSRYQSGSRVDAVKEQARSVIREVCVVDDDGPTVVTFGVDVHVFEDVAEAKAEEVLGTLTARQQGTYLGKALRQLTPVILHKVGLGHRVAMLIFTDGEASDADEVMAAIANLSHQIPSRDKCSILVVTIGDEAAAFMDQINNRLTDERQPANLRAAYDLVAVKSLEWAVKQNLEQLLHEAFTG